MFAAPRGRAHRDLRSKTSSLGHRQMAGQDGRVADSRVAAPLAREVSDALWEGASLTAVDNTSINARRPGEPKHVTSQTEKQLAKPPEVAASQEQALRDELLANDSLGG